MCFCFFGWIGLVFIVMGFLNIYDFVFVLNFFVYIKDVSEVKVVVSCIKYFVENEIVYNEIL